MPRVLVVTEAPDRPAQQPWTYAIHDRDLAISLVKTAHMDLQCSQWPLCEPDRRYPSKGRTSTSGPITNTPT